MTELFRFAVVRPAEVAPEPLKLLQKLDGKPLNAFATYANNAFAQVPAADDVIKRLNYNIKAIESPPEDNKEKWDEDKDLLDSAIVKIYTSGNDVQDTLSTFIEYRRLYDKAEGNPKSRPVSIPFTQQSLDVAVKKEEDKNMRYVKDALSAINSTKSFIGNAPLRKNWYDALPSASHAYIKSIVGDSTSIDITYNKLLDAERFKPPPFFYEILGVPKRIPSSVRFAGVADLIVVKEHILRYEGGEIGNIQNVLKSEHVVRETRRLERTSEIDFTDAQSLTEEERDSQTTERFSMGREVNNVIKEDSSTKAGVSISGSYGPTIEVTASLDTARNKSSEQSAKVASTYSKDVTSRAAKKVTEMSRKSKTVQTLLEYQENYKHEFNNVKGEKNISGLYQWVNKVTQSQMYNYDKRQMLDIVVPEPAAFLAAASVYNKELTMDKPLPITENVNETNYADLAKRYFVTGVLPPPAETIVIGKSVGNKAPDPNSPEINDSTEVQVPTGYVSKTASIRIQWGELTGTKIIFSIGKYNEDLSMGDKEVRDNVPIGNFSGSVPFSIFATARAYSANLMITCDRTTESFDTWRMKTSDAITDAYSRLMADYGRARADADAKSTNGPKGDNPLANVKTIENELKKSCISIMTSQDFGTFGAIENAATGVSGIITGDMPQVSVLRALAQGPYIRFFEQAFEWENMQYIFYPYYWGTKTKWKTNIALKDDDPMFSAFVKAGAARVMFPVRKGFVDDVAYFLQTGKVWSGGPVPTVGSDNYISISEEIRNSEKQSENPETYGEPWEVVVPTNLVILRDELPTWSKDKDGKWTEVKTRT